MRRAICLLGLGMTLATPGTGTAGNDVAALTCDRTRAESHEPQLRQAWAHFDRGETPDARRLFAEVAANADSANTRVQALMGLGWCGRFGRPRPDAGLARRSFSEIVEAHPDHPAAPWALIELGALLARKERGGGDPARPFFERVLADYPESPAAHEAALRLAGTYFYDLDDEFSSQGLEILENHLREHPDHPLAVVMHFRLAHWYMEALQQYSRALPHSLYLAEHRMSDPFRWQLIYWQVAEVYRLRLRQPEKAIPFYARLLLHAPRSMHTLAARRRIEELTGRPWEEVVEDIRAGENGP